MTGKPSNDQRTAWSGWYHRHGAGCPKHGKQGIELIFCHFMFDDPLPAVIECGACQSENAHTVLSRWDEDGPKIAR